MKEVESELVHRLHRSHIYAHGCLIPPPVVLACMTACHTPRLECYIIPIGGTLKAKYLHYYENAYTLGLRAWHAHISVSERAISSHLSTQSQDPATPLNLLLCLNTSRRFPLSLLSCSTILLFIIGPLVRFESQSSQGLVHDCTWSTDSRLHSAWSWAQQLLEIFTIP